MKQSGAVMIILLVFFACSDFSARAQAIGRVTGKLVLKGGKPMRDGTVFFFDAATGPPPAPERYWRVPDKTAQTDPDGRFSAELPEGTYYIAAVQRSRGKRPGPPQPDDFVFISRTADGIPKSYAVRPALPVDLGTLLEAEPLKDVPKRGVLTGIEGTVIDKDGKPVEGAIIFAYSNAKFEGRPLFVTEKTGSNGKYLLGVHEGGRFYLRARDVYGGGPLMRDGLMGEYGETEPDPIEVKTGAITKNIRVKVMKFLGRGHSHE